jgi:hypothetical protein
MNLIDQLKKDISVKVYEEKNLSLPMSVRSSNIANLLKQIEKDISLKIRSSKPVTIVIL